MIAIRPATPLDIGALDALMARSYGPLLRADYPPSVLVVALPRIARAQPALLASGHYFVAEDGDGTLLGAGGWSRGSPHGGRNAPGLGHVRHVATDVRHARRGVGRAVMAMVLEDAGRYGVTQLHCTSTLTAVPFYEALGFTPHARVTLSFGAAALAFPAVEMTRDL